MDPRNHLIAVFGPHDENRKEVPQAGLSQAKCKVLGGCSPCTAGHPDAIEMADAFARARGASPSGFAFWVIGFDELRSAELWLADSDVQCFLEGRAYTNHASWVPFQA